MLKLIVVSDIIITIVSLQLNAIKRYGGEVIKVPYDTWWNTMVTRKYDGIPGHFIHPVCEKEVIAGKRCVYY